MLSSYMYSGVARPGMTNPPMNPETKRICLSYLKEWDVPHLLEPSSKGRSASSPAIRVTTAGANASAIKKQARGQSPKMGGVAPKAGKDRMSFDTVSTCSPRLDGGESMLSFDEDTLVSSFEPGQPSGIVWTASGDATPGGAMAVASMPEGRLPDLPLCRSMGRKDTNKMKGGPYGNQYATSASAAAASSGSRRKHGVPVWLSDVREMQEERVGPPEPSEKEFRRWRHVLEMKSCDHGREIDRREVSDLAQLKCYHSAASQKRSRERDVCQQEDGKAASDVQWLTKALKSNHKKLLGADRRRNARLSKDVSASAPALPSAKKREEYFGEERRNTASYLTRLAETVETAGPSRLEAMARAARVSVATGCKLPSLGRQQDASSEDEA